MKIIHVEGGLGNQMACYAVYVAAKRGNPDEEIFIDTYLYDITEAHGTISMWNGYELGKVFGIEIPDIRSLFSPEEIEEQLNYLRKSEFWKHGWNYDIEFIRVMEQYGIYLKNAYGNVGENLDNKAEMKVAFKRLLRKYGAKTADTYFAYELKRFLHAINKKINKDCGEYLLKSRDGNFFYNITLDFMKSTGLQGVIGDDVRKGLTFKEPTDKRNIEYLELINKLNSISIHIRRTDYLEFNEDCYKYGYFLSSIQYIKKVIKDPVFFVFSDDLPWCKEHAKQIGFAEDDKIYFVDINVEENSYRDMQLMSSCKHNISTKSSFGWWAGFLNTNPQKITVCQTGSYVSTVQF